MAISHSSFFLFTSALVLFYFNCFNKAYGREILESQHHHVIEIKSLLPATTCSTFSSKGLKGSPSMLPIYHKDGPCSPLSREDKKPKTLNITQILIQDQSRVQSLHSKISKGGVAIEAEEARLPVTSGSSLNTGNYVVSIGFGTPKRDFPVIFDTGSDLTWIQCEPCLGSCYPQRDPIFDPSKSSSYSNISCSSPECTQLRSGTGRNPSCKSSSCVYAIQYGDQSYSIGFFGHEKLTLTPSDVFPNFQFGCGQQNNGLFGKTAGLLGLGRNRISLVSQTAAKFNKLFSYCIPPPSSSSGYLAFGPSPSSSVKFTELVSDSREPSFYFLNLQAISVGGNRLSIPPSTFTSSGTIIDSGTVITRLPPDAYSALRLAFKQAMSSYKSGQPFSILDTCYDLSGVQTVTFPTIVLHFTGGTDLNVDQSGILVAASVSQVCLGFAGNSDSGAVAIIGNKQQQTFQVVHDVANGKIGFGPGGCS